MPLRLPCAEIPPRRYLPGDTPEIALRRDSPPRRYLRALEQREAACEHAVALLEGSTRAQFFNIGLQRCLSDCD